MQGSGTSDLRLAKSVRCFPYYVVKREQFTY